MVSGPCDLRSLVPGVSSLGRFSNLCCGMLGYVAWFFFFPLASHVLLLLFGTCPQLCFVVSCGAFISAVPGNCQELFLALRVFFSYCAPFVGPKWRISHLSELTCVSFPLCVHLSQWRFPVGVLWSRLSVYDGDRALASMAEALRLGAQGVRVGHL